MPTDKHSEPSFDEDEGQPGHGPGGPGSLGTPDPDWLGEIGPPPAEGGKGDSGLGFGEFLNAEETPKAEAPDSRSGSGFRAPGEPRGDTGYLDEPGSGDTGYLGDPGSGGTGVLGDPGSGGTGMLGDPGSGGTGVLGDPGSGETEAIDTTKTRAPITKEDGTPVGGNPWKWRAGVAAAVLAAAAVSATITSQLQKTPATITPTAPGVTTATATATPVDTTRSATTPAKPTPSGEVDPKVLDEAVTLTGDPDPAKATRGMRMIVDAAVKENDHEVIDTYVERLGPLLEQPDRVSSLQQICEQLSKDPVRKNERSRFKHIHSKLRALQGSGPVGAEPAAGNKGRHHQGMPVLMAHAASRSSRGPTRVLLTSARRAAAPPSDEAAIQLADDAIIDDPTYVPNYNESGTGNLKLARKRRDKNLRVESVKYYNNAVEKFLAGLDLKPDPRGKLSKKLLTGLKDAIKERHELTGGAFDALQVNEVEFRAKLAAKEEALVVAEAARKSAEEKVAKLEAKAPPGGSPMKDGDLKQAKDDLKQAKDDLKQAKDDLETAKDELETAKTDLTDAQAELKTSRDAERPLAAFAVGLARQENYTAPMPTWLAGWATETLNDVWLSGLSRQIAAKGQGPERPAPAHPGSPQGTEAMGQAPTVQANAGPPVVPLARVTLAFGAYAEGLGMFNRSDFGGAEAKFTQAIENYPEDARFYYLRGVARYLAAGGPPFGVPVDAERDVRNGVMLERLNQPPARAIGLDLIRVQGEVRNWLESYRLPGRAISAIVPAPHPPSEALATGFASDRR